MLGAAGLLNGYRATTHWSAIEHLASFGATPVKTRVCIDRNRVTGGGVTAGIDFALTLAAELSDRTTAEMIQLGLEYNPAPPFRGRFSGDRAARVLARLEPLLAPSRERRRVAMETAAARMV